MTVSLGGVSGARPERRRAPSSARNRLAGRIARLTPSGAHVRVTIDCGVTIEALVTHRSAEEMGLAPGAAVIAQFKATAPHLLGPPRLDTARARGYKRGHERPAPAAVLNDLPKEVRMPDTEALIERLAVENPEFRMLREEHHSYEVELTDLNGRGFLSADQHWRVSELKKLKLIAKDRMEAILRQARAAAHA